VARPQATTSDLRCTDQPLQWSGETGRPVSPQKSILIYIYTEIHLTAPLFYTSRRREKTSLCSSGPSIPTPNLTGAHWLWDQTCGGGSGRAALGK